MDELRSRFRLTHPFHPLRGREFELVEQRGSWGRNWLSFRDDEGHLVAVPSSWTDAQEPDPFVVLAAGRSCFRVDDLLRLAELIEGSKS